MFVLPVLFWPCPSPQVEIRQTEVKHQLDVSSNQFPYVFHKKLFCHAASRVRMGGSSDIFLHKSVHSQTFKRQWTSYSHLSKHSFLLPYTFWEDSTVMSFCLLLPLDAPEGSLDAVFTIYKKVPDFIYFLLWTEEISWLSLACLSLSQPLCHNVNREILF